MNQQLPLPLETRHKGAPRFDVDDMRLLIRTVSPSRVCNLAVRARRRGGSIYLRALAGLVAERARRLKDGRPRRRLFWAAAELLSEVGDYAAAADLYAKAADGLEDQGDALRLACCGSRALCLAHLGFRTEAADELERYRAVASDFPSLVWAGLELRMGGLLASLDYAVAACVSYSIAYGTYWTTRRPRMGAEAIMGWGRCEMLLGRAEDAVTSFTIARRLYGLVDDERGIGRADQLLGEAYRLCGRPDEQMLASEQAFESFERYGELLSAAASLAVCADAAARMGDVKTRDNLYTQTFKLLVKAAMEERDGPTRSAVRVQAAQLRLEYADYLAEDDESCPQALDQVCRAVADLRSLRDIGARRLARALNAVGQARRVLEGSVRRVRQPGPGDSPPRTGFRLLSPDCPALVLHLGVCLDPN